MADRVLHDRQSLALDPHVPAAQQRNGCQHRKSKQPFDIGSVGKSVSEHRRHDYPANACDQSKHAAQEREQDRLWPTWVLREIGIGNYACLRLVPVLLFLHLAPAIEQRIIETLVRLYDALSLQERLVEIGRLDGATAKAADPA